MSIGRKSISSIIDSIAASIGPGVGLAREIPRVAHSNWREEMFVVHYLGKGKFSSGSNFIWDPSANKF